MANQIKSPVAGKLVYFESWVDPVAMELLGDQRAIDVVKLHYDDPVSTTLATMKLANGYQIAPRGELRQPWFGDVRLLRAAPALLAISSTGSGYDMVDVDACTEAGVIVCSQTGSNSISVAEHALGLILALLHKLVVADRALRVQDNVNRFDYAGTDVNGKVIGLVGIGQIGTRVAGLCKALGMKVIAFDPHLPDARIEERGATPSNFHDLLRDADVVSLHCPRTPETLNMFDASAFRRMKRGAWFVSTARGGIHVEDDLYDALVSGHLAGAGVDVFLQEPPSKSHPLLSLANVIATPHSAGLSREAVRGMASYAANQWIDIFSGRVPPRLVNPQAWTRYSGRFKAAFGFAPEALQAQPRCL